MLKKLNWSRSLTAKSPIHTYRVVVDSEVDGKFIVIKTRLETGQTELVTGFDSVEAAQDWCYYKHYLPKMQQWLEPDSVTDIMNWFKAAKPKPTNRDKLVQIGCHYEEVAEMMVSVIGAEHMGSQSINNCANGFKGVRPELVDIMQPKDNPELLDSLCDQIVTAIGVGYMMGFDMQGALAEVIRSNNSKMVDGKFEFDENGKIKKPKSFSEPNLKPFVGVNHGKA